MQRTAMPRSCKRFQHIVQSVRRRCIDSSVATVIPTLVLAEKRKMEKKEKKNTTTVDRQCTSLGRYFDSLSRFWSAATWDTGR